MNPSFDARWKAWQRAYKQVKKSYKSDIWRNVVGDSLDKVLDELGEMVLGTTAEQRLLIEKAIKEHKIEAWDLVIYVRRVGLRLQREQKIELLDRSLTIAAICSHYEDPRDVLISMMLLVAGARKCDIPIEEYAEKLAEIPDHAARELLGKALQQSEESVSLTIEKFGPLDWRSPG